MGYTTDFSGAFDVTPTLTPEHRGYLTAFARTRRMKRNPEITSTFPDPLREAVGLPIGKDAGYYVGSTADFGQDNTPDIVDYNSPPGMTPISSVADFNAGWAKQEQERANGEQPGLWCQWIPNEYGTVIEWDGGEKFYHYEQWLQYLIVNFLKPWGYKLNGTVEWEGEDSGDLGKIIVDDNEITIKTGRVVYD